MSQRRILVSILVVAATLGGCTASGSGQAPATSPNTSPADLAVVPTPVATPTASPSPTPLPTPDISSVRVSQAVTYPASTGDLGSWVFVIGTVENREPDYTARVTLRLVGVSSDNTMTLRHPVMWVRPGATLNIQAVWVASSTAKYEAVQVEVSDVALYDLTNADWEAGFSASDVACSDPAPTKPPKCSATNGFAVPLSLVQYVTLQRDAPPAEEFGGFVWSGSATIVAAGATEPLPLAGLSTWWKSSFAAMSDAELWWSKGWSLAADQPGLGAPVR
jgi:hypothetical protein